MVIKDKIKTTEKGL